MKKPFGIDTRIKTEEGDYIIETFADSRNFRVVSEIFFEGRVVEVKEISYEPSISEDGLIRLIHKLQNASIDVLQNLFDLDELLKKKATAEGFYRIGRLFFKRKLIDRAITSYEECLKCDPNFADAFKDIGRILGIGKNYKEAKEYLSKAIEIESERPDYHFHLGKILFNAGETKEAGKSFSRALELNSDYAEAYFFHGLALLKEFILLQDVDVDEERIILIEVDLKNASILDEKFREKSYNEALKLLKKHSYNEALKQFLEFSTKFMEIEAHDVIDEFTLFAKYSKKKISLLTVDEYINNILALIEENSEYADLHNALGKAYILKVRALLNASSLQFQKALEINPEYEEAKRDLELVVNEGKGILLLLRAILK